ncbi:hypothetical protein VTN77DRAFT_6835 [Rasamsonia byssochlamydoides]|uniref:uncharacterized protein n=1 Tax=Rasamsonia byssochlamydoides TaxID=89139 RepID=UPI003741F6B8
MSESNTNKDNTNTSANQNNNDDTATAATTTSMLAPAPALSPPSSSSSPHTTENHPPAPAEPKATGTFQIHYFASAASYTKKDTEALPAPLPLRHLFSLLEEKYPGIRERVLRSCSVSLGLEYVDVDEEDNDGDEGGSGSSRGIVIQAGDEVGIIPPVSSG